VQYGLSIEDGQRAIYIEDVPETRGQGKAVEGWRRRVVIADAKGKNGKPLISGLGHNGTVVPHPDGKAVVCVAEVDGKWDVYRVPFDGTAPVRLSLTSGTDPVYAPAFRLLPDGRVVYHAVAGRHVEKQQFGTFSTNKGAVVLTDGKKETVLLKEQIGGLPELTADATKMAVAGTSDTGAPVVEVTDLTTSKKEQFALSAFNKDWTCRFRELKFSPDGKALAVTFFLGNVVFREKGPLPGDEAVQHFGVIWLDGRKDQTKLFQIDQPLKEHGYFPEIDVLEWAAAPVAKK
jgi:Tol biopolymer transport system component